MGYSSRYRGAPQARVSISGSEPAAKGWAARVYRRLVHRASASIRGCSSGSQPTTLHRPSFYSNVLVQWDLETGERIGTLEGHQAGVRAVAFGPYGRRAVSVSDDDSLILWDLSSGRPLARLNAHRSDVLDLALVPDGRTALSSSRDGGLIAWELVDAAEMQRLAGHGIQELRTPPSSRLSRSYDARGRSFFRFARKWHNGENDALRTVADTGDLA